MLYIACSLCVSVAGIWQLILLLFQGILKDIQDKNVVLYTYILFNQCKVSMNLVLYKQWFYLSLVFGINKQNIYSRRCMALQVNNDRT